MTPTRLDAAPLVDAVARRGGLPVILRGRRDRDAQRLERAVQRATDVGYITPDQVDRVCIELLGVNPSLVYGDDWWADVPEPDDIAEAWLAEAS